MKGLLKNALVSAVLIAAQSNAQWTVQISPVKGNLTDIAFYGSKLGYAVGTKGTILLTLDGGRKWSQLKSPVKEDITSVTPIDSGMVMITTTGMNNSAAVYESNDWGKNWTRTISGRRTFAATVASDKSLFSTSSSIYRSSDLGKNWEKTKSLNSTSTYRKVEFTDAQNGIVAGNISGALTYSADLIRTVDGGKNWFNLDNFFYPNANGYSALNAINADSVFMFTNFYNRFSPGDSSQLVLLTNFRLRKIIDIYAWKFDYKIVRQSLPDRINDCRFFNSGKAYAVGDKGIIYTTADPGKKWTMEYKGNVPVKAIFMIDEQNGFAVGDGGLILKRTAVATGAKAPVNMEIKVYPNPATAQVFVEFNTTSDLNIALNIADANGNIRLQVPVKYFNKGTQKITVPLGKLQNGLFHIQLISNETIIASKELMIVH